MRWRASSSRPHLSPPPWEKGTTAVDVEPFGVEGCGRCCGDDACRSSEGVVTLRWCEAADQAGGWEWTDDSRCSISPTHSAQSTSQISRPGMERFEIDRAQTTTRSAQPPSSQSTSPHNSSPTPTAHHIITALPSFPTDPSYRRHVRPLIASSYPIGVFLFLFFLPPSSFTPPPLIIPHHALLVQRPPPAFERHCHCDSDTNFPYSRHHRLHQSSLSQCCPLSWTNGSSGEEWPLSPPLRRTRPTPTTPPSRQPTPPLPARGASQRSDS